MTALFNFLPRRSCRVANTISKNLYRIHRTLGHRLTVYATTEHILKVREHKLKVYATISIRNGITMFPNLAHFPLLLPFWFVVCLSIPQSAICVFALGETLNVDGTHAGENSCPGSCVNFRSPPPAARIRSNLRLRL